MSRLFKLSIVISLTLVLLLSFALILCVDIKATHNNSTAPNAHDYASIGAIGKQLIRDKKAALNPTKLRITPSEIQSIERIASQQLRNSFMKIDLHNGKVNLGMSIHVTHSLWVNISAEVPEQTQFAIQNLRIGRVTILNSITNKMIDIAIRRVLHSNLDELNAHIDSIRINDTELRLNFNPAILSAVDSPRALATLQHLGGNTITLDAELINHYRNVALALSKTSLTQQQSHSIALYLNELLRNEPHDRRTNNAFQNTNEDHALIALTSLSGIALFNNALAINEGIRPDKIPFTLNQRRDLAKHFLLSAAINIVSNKSTSFSIGEAKELLDSKKGGSGFSFIDLTADRAGTYFSQHLSQHGTHPVFSTNRALTEDDFFPDISTLREHLDAEQFKHDYKSTTSAEYKAVLTHINEEIEKLRFFKADHKI